FKQHCAEHSGAHEQQTDSPDRVLVGHIGVHDEAHDVSSLFRLTGGHARKEYARGRVECVYRLWLTGFHPRSVVHVPATAQPAQASHFGRHRETPATASSDRRKSDVAIKLTRIKNVQSKASADLATLEITPKTELQPRSRRHRPIMCIQGPLRVHSRQFCDVRDESAFTPTAAQLRTLPCFAFAP